MTLLTPEQVMAIRVRADDGVATTDLAREYGVGRREIYRIIVGLTWPHVGGPVRARRIYRRQGVIT